MKQNITKLRVIMLSIHVENVKYLLFYTMFFCDILYIYQNSTRTDHDFVKCKCQKY